MMTKKSIVTAISILILLLLIVITVLVKRNKTPEQINNIPIENTNNENLIEDADKPRITLNPKNDYKEYDIEYQSFTGIETDILLKNCYSLYSTYWANEIKKYPDHQKYYQNIVDNPQNDIKLKKISNNIAIIERTSSSMSYDNLVRVEDIWLYQKDTWKLFEGFSNVDYKTELLDVNGDELIDALVIGGCCDNETCNVLIGDKDAIFINIQDINYYGFIRKDQIGNKVTGLTCKPYDGEKGKTYKLKFDNQKNIFIEQ